MGHPPTNNRYMLGGATYDANGDLLTDTFHTYAWDSVGHVTKIDSSTCGTNGTCLTYDAFGRPVEKSMGATYSEILYSQLGKTAVMNGNIIIEVYIPLPGGSTYHMVPGAQHFWHPDWLGTIRLSSGRGSRAPIYDRAFAPFGEVYLNFGATDRNNFTGDTQDILPGVNTPGAVVAGLFDTPNRELHPFQGRWLSPDPAGLSATDPGNPQSWNRYAYVINNPLILTDPSGTDFCDNPFSDLPCDLTGDLGLHFYEPIVTGLGRDMTSSIFTDGDLINFPTPDLFTTIWQDVLGLPTNLNCPVISAPLPLPLCGGMSPVSDLEPLEKVPHPQGMTDGERKALKDLLSPITNWLFPTHKKFCHDNHNNMEFDAKAGTLLGIIAAKTKNPLVADIGFVFGGSAVAEYGIDRGFCKPDTI